MNWQGNVIVWGGLLLCIVLIIVGIWLPHSWYARTLLAAGIVGGIVWVIGIFQLAIAMNSDI